MIVVAAAAVMGSIRRLDTSKPLPKSPVARGDS